MYILELSKYVEDLDIGLSARRKKLSRSLNSSTERRVGWASDPTSPPMRDLSIGGATLQLNNMRDFKLLARTKRVGKLKNRKAGKILPLPPRNTVSLVDDNAMPNPSSLNSAKSDDLLDSEDNESLIMSSKVSKKIPTKLKKIKKKIPNVAALKNNQRVRNEKFVVENGEDTPSSQDWYDSEKLPFYEEGQTSTESEDSLHRESDIPGLMSVSEPATRSQTGERLEKLDPRVVINENDEITLEESSPEAVQKEPEYSSNSEMSGSDETSTVDESENDVVIDVIEKDARPNPSDEALETSAGSEQNNNTKNLQQFERQISPDIPVENNRSKSSENRNASESKPSLSDGTKQNETDDFFDGEHSSTENNLEISIKSSDSENEKEGIQDSEEEEKRDGESDRKQFSELEESQERSDKKHEKIIMQETKDKEEERSNDDNESEESIKDQSEMVEIQSQKDGESKQEALEKTEENNGKDSESDDKKEKDLKSESGNIEDSSSEKDTGGSDVNVDEDSKQDLASKEESDDYAKDEEENSDETESSDYDSDDDSEYEDSSPLYSDKEDLIEDDLHLSDALTPEPPEDVEVTKPHLLDHFGEKIEGLIESDYDTVSLKNETQKTDDISIKDEKPKHFLKFEGLKGIDPDDMISVPSDTNNVLTILEHNSTLEHSNDSGEHILPDVTFGGTVDEIVTKLTTKAVIHERSVDVDPQKADFAAFNWKPDVQFFQFGQTASTPKEEVFNFGAGTPPPPQLVKRRPATKLPRSRSIRRERSVGLERIHKS